MEIKDRTISELNSLLHKTKAQKKIAVEKQQFEIFVELREVERSCIRLIDLKTRQRRDKLNKILNLR